MSPFLFIIRRLVSYVSGAKGGGGSDKSSNLVSARRRLYPGISVTLFWSSEAAWRRAACRVDSAASGVRGISGFRRYS